LGELLTGRQLIPAILTAEEKTKRADSAIPAAKSEKTDQPVPSKSIQSPDEEDLDSPQVAVI
jgi:hypothetical protein